jgi:hypothetical protein
MLLLQSIFGLPSSFPVRAVSTEILYAFVVKYKFLGAFEKLRKATIIFDMSARLCVCPSAWNISTPTGRILMKFDIWNFLENV